MPRSCASLAHGDESWPPDAATQFLTLIGGPHAILLGAPALADGSGPELASYYERHVALLGGVAYGWTGRAAPLRMRAGARQVGASRDAFFALLEDGGRLVTWDDAPAAEVT